MQQPPLFFRSGPGWLDIEGRKVGRERAAIGEAQRSLAAVEAAAPIPSPTLAARGETPSLRTAAPMRLAEGAASGPQLFFRSRPGGLYRDGHRMRAALNEGELQAAANREAAAKAAATPGRSPPPPPRPAPGSGDTLAAKAQPVAAGAPPVAPAPSPAASATPAPPPATISNRTPVPEPSPATSPRSVSATPDPAPRPAPPAAAPLASQVPPAAAETLAEPVALKAVDAPIAATPDTRQHLEPVAPITPATPPVSPEPASLPTDTSPVPAAVATSVAAAGRATAPAPAAPHPGSADAIAPAAGSDPKPPSLDAPRAGRADDLKLIKGIGPKNETACHALGVYHHDQIAAWSSDHAAWVGHHLAFPGRIEREHWVDQARLLSMGIDTPHAAAVRSGATVIDDTADAPLSDADAAALRSAMPAFAPPVADESRHGGRRPVGLAAAHGGTPDDLQRIKGIGKQNEARLQALGIWHFGQIAKWTPDHVQWVGSYLAFPGRITREGWVAQAAILADGGAAPAANPARQ